MVFVNEDVLYIPTQGGVSESFHEIIECMNRNLEKINIPWEVVMTPSELYHKSSDEIEMYTWIIVSGVVK